MLVHEFQQGSSLIIFVIQFEIFVQYFRPIDFHCCEVAIRRLCLVEQTYVYVRRPVGRAWKALQIILVVKIVNAFSYSILNIFLNNS